MNKLSFMNPFYLIMQQNTLILRNFLSVSVLSTWLCICRIFSKRRNIHGIHTWILHLMKVESKVLLKKWKMSSVVNCPRNNNLIIVTRQNPKIVSNEYLLIHICKCFCCSFIVSLDGYIIFFCFVSSGMP